MYQPLMYNSNIFMIIHSHIISYTFVNSFFPPRYMKIYFTANIIFSAVVPQTLRIMQAAYGLYITLNSILHYAYWVEVHRAVHHKHSFPWMNRHISRRGAYFSHLRFLPYGFQMGVFKSVAVANMSTSVAHERGVSILLCMRY